MAPQEMNKDFDLPGAEKEIGRQGLEKKNKSLKVKDIPKNGNEVQVVEGCWQKPPLDIMENIISRLDVLDRIRLSILCKYWNSIAMRRDIRSTAPPFPWLVLAQRSSDYLEFSIPSEGKVIKIDLPKQIRGRFHSSSKGWLIMVEGKSIFLLNPISGDKQELPSLRNIPSLHNLEEEDEFDSYHVGGGKPPQFLREIALSSSNTSECTVAAIFSSKEIGVCRPGEKSWSIFSMLDDRKGSPLRLLFSSCGMLYVLVKNNEIENEGVITRMLRFGDGDELQLKLVYDKKEESRKNSSQGWGLNDYLDVIIEDKSYLVESTASNEVLLIHQFKNQEIKSYQNQTSKVLCIFQQGKPVYSAQFASASCL
ncbi:unnamed protein product [Malus baccata var. baccata]